MILLLVGARALGDAEDARGVAKLVEHAAVQRIEATLLSGREVEREREGGEVLEDPAHGLEAPLDVGSAWRGGGRLGLGMQATERVTHQLAAVGIIGGAIGFDDRLGVTRLEAMPLDARQESILVLVPERAQRLAQRRSDGARTQLARAGLR
jgi:hypothetical protein